jgi:asparagine synthase (glutamine-hydrolysing)
MCGIWSFIKLAKLNSYSPEKLSKLFQDFWNIKNRGPDYSSLQCISDVWIGFHRLSIVDPSFTSNQPFIFKEKDKTIVFICNGEIYNYKEIIEEFDLKITKTSDCMVIPELYLKYDKKSFLKLFDKKIKGEFAFIMYEFTEDMKLSKVIVGRDQIGIRPLYYHPPNKDSKTMMFSSEIKGTNSYDEEIIEFPPGHISTYDINNGFIDEESTYIFKWVYDIINDMEMNYLENVKLSVINSVKRRLHADRPIAFLLSGGVDSSLVAGIAAKESSTPINTFCCGMSEGTDLVFARKVAEYIGSNHTEVFFTQEEALNAITDVIWTTETWDTTTIRASVGQYIVSKHIGTKTDAKVVLVGEGPDELCSSYLFNWNAPNGKELHNAALEYVEKIHYFDSKRGDRCLSRWGLEGRVPLLDPEFIEAYWNIPADFRMPTYKKMEKWWLRQAFANSNTIPDEVLWRKKEAFSDGVSGKNKSWFQIIQDFIEDKVTDIELKEAESKYPYHTPKTKEAYYYRRIFCEMFGENRQIIIPHYWQPKWNTDGKKITEYIDPSARVLSVYN